VSMGGRSNSQRRDMNVRWQKGLLMDVHWQKGLLLEDTLDKGRTRECPWVDSRAVVVLLIMVGAVSVGEGERCRFCVEHVPRECTPFC
jgi:hypothetical protein